MNWNQEGRSIFNQIFYKVCVSCQDISFYIIPGLVSRSEQVNELEYYAPIIPGGWIPREALSRVCCATGLNSIASGADNPTHDN